MKYILYTYTSVFFKRVYFKHLDSWTRIRGPKRTQTHTHTQGDPDVDGVWIGCIFFVDPMTTFFVKPREVSPGALYDVAHPANAPDSDDNMAISQGLNFVSLHVFLYKLGGGNSNIFVTLKSGKKKINRYFFLWKKYEKNMNSIFGDLCFFYDLFMICLCFLGFPLFFIDFPKEFLDIFDFSLIFLEFFVKSLIF